MALKQSLEIKLGQHLTLTPQLQQAIQLLQLSTIELQAKVQDLLESNPMLELEDESQSAPQVSFANNNAEDEIRIKEDIDNWKCSVNHRQESMQRKSEISSDYSFETNHTVPESLHDHLMWQVYLTPLNDYDRAIAIALVDAIDDHGFLTQSLEEVSEVIGPIAGEMVALDEIEAVLHRIHRFDPLAIGSRNLQECLSIQLQTLPENTVSRELALALVANHLTSLTHHDRKNLLKRYKTTEAELNAAIQLIQSLNPRPGSQISAREPEYIIPDLIVKKVHDRWEVRLNDEVSPKIKINEQYANLIQRADPCKDNMYLKEHLQEARWFLKSLQSRQDTLLKVAIAIMSYQANFLATGPEAMKPLILHDIADLLEMHESTISRVTTGKYIHTPQGIFELKYFFSSHVRTNEGGECSSTAIRALIKRLVAAEDHHRPLSDSKIATLLKEQGINVARRTITKYRENLGILASHERKCAA